jgi:hypothetical protein
MTMTENIRGRFHRVEQETSGAIVLVGVEARGPRFVVRDGLTQYRFTMSQAFAYLKAAERLTDLVGDGQITEESVISARDEAIEGSSR